MAGFTPQIDVEINQVYFVFSWKVHKRKVATLVSLDSNSKELVAIGEKAEGEGVTSLSLFGPEGELPPGMERMDLLILFLEFNIAKLLEKQRVLMFKPKVVFHEDGQLNSLLCGYQRALLRTAALEA